MQLWQFILFIISWLPIQYLCVRWEVKRNPDLFYALNRDEIIRVLEKEEKRKDVKD